MKSVKLYFSLLLSAVMLAVAVPAMAQDVENIDAASVAEDVIVAEGEQLDVVAHVVEEEVVEAVPMYLPSALLMV